MQPDNPTTTETKPVASHCRRCGDGYQPGLAIRIHDEPTDGEYRWEHEQCPIDRDGAAAEVYRLGGGFEEQFVEVPDHG